jgi:pimeloyl-ACP methyl ester carboxylesterase
MVAFDRTNSNQGMIAVPGERIWYRIDGPDAPGIPLLVLHGAPGIERMVLSGPCQSAPRWIADRRYPWPECLQRALGGLGMQVYMAMWGPSDFTCTGSLPAVDMTPWLAQINVPTLLNCGRYDEATPETVEYFCHLIPGAQMQVFEDASHNHHLEQPQAYRAALRAFLR